MSFRKKRATPVIDSRYLKVLAAKREDLKDAVVFICLNEEKYGHVEKSHLHNIIQQIDSLEPTGVYFPMLMDMDIQFYSRNEFRNKDLVITIKHQNAEDADTEVVEDEIRSAIPNARSIKFIHEDVKFGGLL
jgi:hypothetical protein